MSAACAAMSVATSTSPRAALHWYPARRLPSSASTQSTASRQPGPFQCSQRLGRLAGEVLGVPVASRLERRPCSAKPVLGELADGLEEAVAGAGGGVVGDHERLADQRVEMPEHVDLVGVVAHRVEARQVEAAGEDRREAEQVPLVVGQEVVRPLHRMAQRELSLRRRASTPCNSRNRSASRSRTSTALMAAMREAASSMPSGSPSRVSQISVTAVGGLRFPEPEVGPDGAGAVDEQRDGVGGLAAVQRQRHHGEHASRAATATRSRDVARTLTVPVRPRIVGDGRSRRGQDVLAVVDHERGAGGLAARRPPCR